MYLHDGNGFKVCHMFSGEEGRKTLEEEILDGCGHRVHGYVQAIQVHVLIRKIILLFIKISASNLNIFIPISNSPPPPFLRIATFNKIFEEYPIVLQKCTLQRHHMKTTERIGTIRSMREIRLNFDTERKKWEVTVKIRTFKISVGRHLLYVVAAKQNLFSSN
jgi:hypothetical protein